MLGPQLRIQSAATLRRLLAYLGGTPEQLADFENCHRRWGQGTVLITLQPGRKNLLRIDYQRLNAVGCGKAKKRRIFPYAKVPTGLVFLRALKCVQ